jgi:hypothetical protein
VGHLIVEKEGQLRFLGKSAFTFGSQLQFLWMKAYLVDYVFGEKQGNSELKIVKYGYIRACPKEPATSIISLEILRVIFFRNWVK